MQLHELIEHAEAQGIAIRAVDGKLAITADDALLTDAVLAALKAHKQALAAYFTDEVPATAIDADAPHALSLAQRRLYFLYQYDRSATHFNLPVELALDGALDADSLEQALQAVIERHAIFQTTYLLRDGVGLQRREPGARIRLERHDLEALPEAARQARLDELRQRAAGTPFDLSRELPLRAHLVRHAAERFSLLFVFHHIATDEWSIQLLVRDLSAAYAALRRGEAPPAAPAGAARHADFVAWQTARLAGGGYEVARSYWRDHLRGVEPVLELPLDHPRPAVLAQRVGLAQLPLDDARRTALAGLAQRLGISEFSLFLGAGYLLLARLSSRRDLVVGTDVFGRDHARFQDVAGFFVNQLALRSQLPAEGDAAAYLTQVHRETTRSLRFQELPFDQVVDDLKVDRDPSHAPVFQVKFLYRRNDTALPTLDGVRVADTKAFRNPSQYDLTLQVLPGEVLAHYHPELFEPATVRGWLDLYAALLDELLASTAQPLPQLLSDRLQRQLAPWSQGEVADIRADAPFAGLEQAVATRGSQVAVQAGDQRLDYQAFGERVAQVAGHLVALGVRPGDRVAVHLERSPDMVVAAVAVMRAGAVLVPLDSDYPIEQVEHMLADSAAALLITRRAMAESFGEFYGVTLDIAALYQRSPQASPPPLDSLPGDAPAYLLYTSGSTGQPKGVLVSRAAFANLCQWYADFARIDADSRVLLMIPFGFDASLKNIFVPLMQGATLVLNPPGPFEPQALVTLIDTQGITTVNSVPTALYMLLQQDAARDYRSLRSLRVYAVGGEALDLERVRPWLRSAHCGAELANIYGPTECTDISLAFKADRHGWLARERVPIGRPIRNLQAWIVDEALAPCPPGAIGELLVGGAGVALGYHGMSDATARAFIDWNGRRVYRTGDFCRHGADGQVEYLGRRDGQVKIRGKRIETGEVAAQLARLLPGRDISVQLYRRSGLEMLLAFHTGAPLAAAESTDLRATLARRLPQHAVPARLVQIDALPLSAHGKVSAAALLDHHDAVQAATPVDDTPLDATEQAIAGVWQRLLNAPAIGAQTSFFGIGGDSIFSIQLVSELRKLGYEVSVADVFKHPTLQALARLCEARPVDAAAGPGTGAANGPEPFALVPPADRARLPPGLEDAYPVTALQQGMLFHMQMAQSSAVYHDVFSYDLRFDYDAGLFRRALETVLRHNPALRTSFDAGHGALPLQRVHRELRTPLSGIDLRGFPADQQERLLRATLVRLKQSTLDAGEPGLVRFTVLQRAADRIHLVIDAHHAILDGWSLATVQRQLFECYQHLQRGTPLGPLFEPVEGGLAAHVAAQLADEADEAARAHWQAHARLSANGALHPDWPLLPEVAMRQQALPRALLDRLGAVMAVEGLTLKTLLLAAHLHMLRSLLPGAAVRTAVTDNSRPETAGAERLVGLFLNVLPVRASFGNATWRDLARALQADEAAGKPFRRYPFASIARDNRQLVCDALFTYNHFHVADALKQADWLQVTADDGFEETNFKVDFLAHGSVADGVTLRLQSTLAVAPAQLELLLQEAVFALERIADGIGCAMPAVQASPLPWQAGGTLAELRWRGAAAPIARGLARFELQRLARDPLEAEAGPTLLAHETDGYQHLSVTRVARPGSPDAQDSGLAEVIERCLAEVDALDTLELRTDGAWHPAASLQAGWALWRERIGEPPAPPALPADANDALAGWQHATVELPAQALQRLSDAHRSTPQVALLAAWLGLLARIGLQDRVATGLLQPAPAGLRPVCIGVDDDPDAATLLRRAAEGLAQTLSHHPLPPEYAAPTSALYGSALVLEGASLDALPACTELALQVSADGSRVQLASQASRFSPATAQGLAGALASLAGAMAGDGTRPLSRLSLADGLTRSELRALAHGAYRDVPQQLCLHELFELQAARTPQQLALSFDGRTLDYAALNAQANQLARHLRDHGAAPDRLVAVCVPRGIEMVLAILAVLKSGAAYVPLDPGNPAERLDFILHDSAPCVLLTQGTASDALQRPAGLAVIALDAAEPAWRDAPAMNLPVAETGLTPGHLAYVMYTSGSTGQPKGVMVEHRNVVNLLHGHAALTALSASDRVLQFASFAFDSSVTEIFGTLSFGATLVLKPDALRSPDAGFVDHVVQHGITLMDLPTAFWHRWAQELEAGRSALPAGVRLVSVGGEKAEARHLQTWQAHASTQHCRWINAYGPTEATVNATYLPLDGPPALQGGEVPIGRPGDNGQAWLLDAALQPVPPGVPGELCIGGAGVTRGYLNRPGLSAERFIQHPFDDDPQARLYRTGDLGRWRADGQLEYLGRNDTQVKLRGFRIELGEIEHRLAQQPGVRDALVVLRADHRDEPQLVAYLTAQPGAAPSGLALRTGLQALLPEHMLPTAFVVLPAFPLNANGKLDRRALPAPDDAALARRAYQAPANAAEAEVARIWESLLGVRQVGRDDNFFELGGHSLLAVQMISRVHDALQAELPLRALFEHPTVAEVAALAARPQAASLPLRAAERPADGMLPLSFQQQRLWFIQELQGPSATYNMPAALQVSGPLDVDALRASLQALVARHEALRSNIVSVEGQPQVRIATDLGIELPLRQVTPAEVAERARTHAHHVFDLAHEPLLRVELLRLNALEHVLLLNVHHIVCDGWSLDVLADDWLRLYDAQRRATAARLPALPVQYADYALWQREQLQGERLASQLAYWQQRLAGAPELLNLPTDRPRPAVQTFDGDTETLVLPPALLAGLQRLGRARGASLFMTLVAAFGVLMSRSSGDTDVLVGAPVATRDRAELEGLVGLLVGNLVLRLDLADDPSFEALVDQVRRTALEAYEHGDVPFERVVEALQVRRDLSRNPLFQVYFNMLNLPEGRYHSAEIGFEGQEALLLDAKFDLTLYAQETAAGLALYLVYNRQLFSRERMQEMLRQYGQLLQQVCARPQLPVQAHSLLTDAARPLLPDPTQPLGTAWAGSVPERFAAMLAARPQAPAVVSHERRWSYRELDLHSERIACWLQDQGVVRGDIVAICAERNATLVAAVLGTLKAGAACTLVNPAYPVEHVAACLAVAPPRAWLQVAADAGGTQLLESVAPGLAWLDLARIDDCAALQGLGTRRAAPVVLDADDLAVITFTSGSTGAPKAVEGRHGPLTHFVPWLQQAFGFGVDDRFSMLSGLAHDPLQRDIFTPLCTGGAIHVPHADEIGPGRLARWMAREGITVGHFTPALLQVLCRDHGDARLPQLRRAFVVGDVLTRRDVALLQSIAPQVHIVNYYGSTETQRSVGWYPVDEESPDQALREVIPLGRGIPDVQLLVLNAHGGRAGIGERGEIYLRSAHLARGYRGDAALSAERFLANPFGHGDPQDRVYRTGDLGRYLPDGMVEGLGRADHQVKLRGFRIELGHVESVLSQHPQVRDAVVMLQPLLQPSSTGDRQLVAYLVARGEAPAEAALRAALRDKLPDFMRPAVYVFLERIPLTPNGKVDRKALPIPAGPAAALDATAPRDEAERTLAGLMAEVLQLPQVGVLANFFDLGGHSLLATQLVARIRTAFGVDLPLRALFEAPTVAALAARLAGPQPAAADLPTLRAGTAGGWQPLSFAQQRLWFLDQLDPGTPLYNVPMAVRLGGRLDATALARALDAVLARHDVLRARFGFQAGQPAQRIDAAQPLPWTHHDLRSLPADTREAEARRLGQADALRSFDLQRGPLVRAVLLRLADDEHIAVLTLHHIVSDGWSTGVLLHELGTLYAGTSAATLPRLAVQYADHARWQQQWWDGPDAQRQLAYWTARLQGAPALLQLPLDRPRPAVQSHRGATHAFRVPADTTAALNALARSHPQQATLFMVLCAAFKVLLYRLSGQPDVCVGTPVANRRDARLEPLIGFFANTLVLRSQVDGSQPFEALLSQLRGHALDAYAHQDLPLEKLVEALQPQRHLSHTPLFQAMFVLQNAPLAATALPGLQVAPLETDGEVSKFDLSLTVVESGGELLAGFEYGTDLFDAATIARWTSHFLTLLQALATQPGTPVDRLPLLDAAQRRQLTVEWARSDAAPSAGGTLDARIARHAAERAQQPAVVDGEAVLGHGELDAQAEALAQRLRRLGVGRGARVGLCLERSPALVVGMLAILKTGAAYVPLDPAVPAQRLRQIVADSAPSVVLSRSTLRDTLAQALPAATPLCLVDRPSEDPVGDAPAAADTARPDDLAYVLYTSGSTGVPKGVMVEHRQVVHLAEAKAALLGVTPDDRMLQFASFGFDASVGEIFTTLLAGATLVLRPEALRVPDAAFAALLAAQRISLLDVPTAFWHRWTHELRQGRCVPPASLRVVVVGGEKAELRHLQAWRAHPSTQAIRWVNDYGPTETTVATTALVLPAGDALPERDVPIGRPYPGTSLLLLDRHGEPVPQGVVGEIHIGGAGVARGYLGQPGLTDERFIADPFGDRPEARLYRTGDLGRWRADGNVEYMGRNDSQVKLRGFRIEPGDIQARLAQAPGVREALVVVADADGPQAHLLAYVVPRDGLPPSVRELRAHLAAALPEYMVPAAFVRLPALPTNANGKLDLAALPPPGPDDVAARDYEAPAGEPETLLAAVWAELLGLDRVGRQDHFFELGGHSLLVISLLDRLQQQGWHADVQAVFAAPVLAAMAAALHPLVAAAPAFVAPPNLIPADFGTSAPTAADTLEEFEL